MKPSSCGINSLYTLASSAHLITASQIQLGQVKAAGNHRKARNHKKHRANVSGLVAVRNAKKRFRQFFKADVNHAGGGDSKGNVGKKSYVAVKKLFSDKISDSRAKKAQVISTIPPPSKKVKAAQAAAAASPRSGAE